jgi:hypothetical protein
VNAGVKLTAFVVALLGVVGAGAALGGVVGPIEVDDAEHTDDHDANDAAGHEADPAATELPAGGLLVAQDGYRFTPDSTVLEADTPQPFSFRILGPDGAPVEGYDTLHDKELHLVVVSRDLVQYAHVHPTRDAAGTWSVTVPPMPPGSYRAVADFQPSGHDQLTLGIDLAVAGSSAAPPAWEDKQTASVDGYDVTLEGDLAGDGPVTVTVHRDGELITTEPYLGAAGHLVAIRDGDLAYLHVHPMDEEPAGPVRFAVDVPSSGRYALFFDFSHDGEVRTAPFRVTVGSDVSTDTDHSHAEPGAGH